jgi:hypothetical protein
MEQNKRSAVTNVTANGSFDGQYGTLYKFEITFANGDSGEYASKSQSQTKFQTGVETDYIITDRLFKDRTYYKIAPAMAQPQGQQAPSGGFTQRDPDTGKHIMRMSVLKVAGDLVINGDIQLTEVLAYAQIFEQFVNTGIDTLNTAKENRFKADKGGITKNFMNDAVSHMEDNLPF